MYIHIYIYTKKTHTHIYDIYIYYTSLSLDRSIYPALQSTAGSRVPGFRSSFQGQQKNGAPLPDPEIETQQSLLLGIYPRV
jgi:hypothetical protein